MCDLLGGLGNVCPGHACFASVRERTVILELAWLGSGAVNAASSLEV